MVLLLVQHSNIFQARIVDNIATAQTAELDAMQSAMEGDNFQTAKDGLFADLGVDVDALEGATRLKMSGNLNAFNYNYDSVIPVDQMGTYKSLADAVSNADSFSPEHYAAAGKFHDFMGQLVQTDNAKELTAVWDALKEIPKDTLTMDDLETLVATAESGDAILATI